MTHENHCTPGRKGLNFDEEDRKEIEKQTKELIDGADANYMDEGDVRKSVEAWYGVHKFLNATQCNCYTMPCPDLCASRRLNEKQFTYCLNHSLNNEEGIPSACEYDLGAVFSKILLQNIARRPSYMGNTFTSPIRNGVRAPLPKALFFNPDSVDQKMVDLKELEKCCAYPPLGTQTVAGLAGIPISKMKFANLHNRAGGLPFVRFC